MSTTEIIVAVGAAALVLLLVALIVARRRRPDESTEEPPASFMGSTPRNSFSGLGEPERPAPSSDDELRLDWGRAGAGPDDETGLSFSEPVEAAEAMLEAEPAGETTGASGGDEPAEAAGPPAPADSAGRRASADAAEKTAPVEAAETAAETAEAVEAAEAMIEAEDLAAAVALRRAAAEVEEPALEPAEPAVQPAEPEVEPDERGATDAARQTPPQESTSEGERATAEPSVDGEPAEAAELMIEAEESEAAAQTPPPDGESVPHMVPLSDIIVTTSQKLVDLNDREVRRMLTELVRYEIDQAAEFSASGQSVDAILQLTEAEKVSRALGMDETAERIRALMRDIQD
jgi:hypothetical protein